MSAKFTNSTDYLVSSGVSIPATGTISFWVKPTWAQSDGVQHQFFQTSKDSNNFFHMLKYLFSDVYGGWYTAGSDSRVHTSTFTLNQNAWNIFIMDWTSGSVEDVYLNGTLIGNTTPITIWSTMGTPFYVGNDGTTNVINGKIADMRIWSKILSSQDRTDITNGRAISATNQVNRWQLLSNLNDSWGTANLTANGATFDVDTPAALPSLTSNWGQQAIIL